MMPLTKYGSSEKEALRPEVKDIKEWAVDWILNYYRFQKRKAEAKKTFI